MNSCLRVDTGHVSYPIHIGSALLQQPQLIATYIQHSAVFVVSNLAIAELYLDRLKSALDGFVIDEFLIGDGEHYKTIQTVEDIVGAMLASGQTRETTVIALGGGVVGDIAGFAAAVYQRGVKVIQIPTTLLAQVDSSVGGKTAVNHTLGKNMMGAFHQPSAVLIDVDVLNSLPRRELRAGLAEVIKHGALADADYLSWLKTNAKELLSLHKNTITEMVLRSCEIKSRVVSEDEKEAGVRALLNLGHTFGHAIETLSGYGVWLHGEAVAVGMVMAADLSARLGKLTWEDARYLKSLVEAFELPSSPPGNLTPEQLLVAMARDKKATAKGIRFVLLNALGDACREEDVPVEILRRTLQAGETLCCG
jgi:3-dehydroquinate synthase